MKDCSKFSCWFIADIICNTERIHMPVLKLKPMVAFDVNNVEHRKAYASFLANKKWSEDAPRFAVELPYTSAVSMIMHKMVLFYVNNDMAIQD